MKTILDLFAKGMADKGHHTVRCRNPACRAVLWLESDGSLEDIVKSKATVTLMRYAHIPEEDCQNCTIQQKAARGLP